MTPVLVIKNPVPDFSESCTFTTAGLARVTIFSIGSSFLGDPLVSAAKLTRVGELNTVDRASSTKGILVVLRSQYFPWSLPLRATHSNGPSVSLISWTV